MTHKPPMILQLDIEASVLLDLLVELGHLDEKLLGMVNDRLLDLRIPDGRVTIDDVRRVVAETVFEGNDEVDPEYSRVLDSEWGMLFH